MSDVVAAKSAVGLSAEDNKRVHHRALQVFSKCREVRKRARENYLPEDVSDERLSREAQFTDILPLKAYERCMSLCPRLVNVVTVS